MGTAELDDHGWLRLFSAPPGCPVPAVEWEGGFELLLAVLETDEGADPSSLDHRFDAYPSCWRRAYEVVLANGRPLGEALRLALENGHLPAQVKTAVEAVLPCLQRRVSTAADARESTAEAPAGGEDTAWPALDAAAAFHGLAGDFVRTIEPQTEADPMALLVQILVAFGNVIGRGPYFRVEADRHYLNLFTILVGATSKGRKGTSWRHVERLLETVDQGWASDRVMSGLSSGEGFMWAVRDPTPLDAGVQDKRLLVIEPEFASVLRVQQRRENTLSSQIRQAWDTGSLRTLTRNNPLRATDAHISIIGHITGAELRRELTRTDMANGLANRFLFVLARRSKCLPRGGRIDQVNFEPLVKRLKAAIEFARGVREMTCDAEAEELWNRVYPDLSEGKPGLLGAVTSRAEAQVLRLQCLYALLDCSAVVRKEHLEAALAAWRYCEASARQIFGDSTGDDDADTILQALRDQKDTGLTRTDISSLFGRNAPAARIDRALRLLQGSGLALPSTEETGGRPAEKWRATKETK